ncbi:FMN-binding protein [Beduinella massiliensis]|uniref:FMN-binding protein n=1 Tax=Beduinella massiliensis TaxID=1852363 RepID=UPI000C8506B0
MKARLKKALPCFIAAAAAFILEFVLVAFLLRPQPLQVGTADLGTAADGEYIGVCQNKILFAVVQVEIHDHKISGIEVMEHKASYRKQAEQIAEAVRAKQSLQVDSVSGATLTSRTVLKAIENALHGAERPDDGKQVSD